MRTLLLFTFSLFCLVAVAQPPTCTPPWQVTVTSANNASVLCEGSELTLSGTFAATTSSTLGYSAVWYKEGMTPSGYITLPSNGAVPSYSLPHLRVEDGGFYILRVEYGTSGNSACYKEDSVFVNVVKAPEAQILAPVSGSNFYFTNSATLDLVAQAPLSGETGKWSIVGSGVISSNTTSTVSISTGNFTDTNVVTWTVADNWKVCPESVFELRVIRIARPHANAGPDLLRTLGQAGPLTFTGNLPNYSLQETPSWRSLSPSASLQEMGSIATVTVPTTGTYRFVYTIFSPILNISDSDTMAIIVTAPLGLDETNNDLTKVHVFYAKVQESIVIRSTFTGLGSLLTTNGTLAKEFQLTGNETYVHTATLPRGLYLLYIQTNDGQRICKKVALD